MDWTAIRRAAAGILRQPGLAVTAVWNGRALHGTRSVLKRADVNTDMGLAGSYAFSVLIPMEDFDGAELPAPRRDRMAVDGKMYRVLSVEADAAGLAIRVNLGDLLQ